MLEAVAKKIRHEGPSTAPISSTLFSIADATFFPFDCLQAPHGVKKKCPAVGPVRNKTATEKVIGLYLNRSKLTAKLITEYTYGVMGKHAKAVPKRERYFNAEDVLDMCGFLELLIMLLR